jgi:hypothetical protein
MMRYKLRMLLGLAAFLVPLVAADCECGYSTSISGYAPKFLFTDIIESDFLHIPNITLDTDWNPQSFTMTPAVARGPYGM